MRQGFREQGQGRYPPRGRRTQPALPGATVPTVPGIARPPLQSGGLYEPKHPLKQPATYLRRALWLLSLLGLCMEALWLAMYPLLSAVTPTSNAARTALLHLYPWLPRLSWTSGWPWLAQLVSRAPIFHIAATQSSSGPTGGTGAANLLLLLLGLAFIVTLIAGRIGRNVMRERLTAGNLRALLSIILLFTFLAGLLLLVAPGPMTGDIFLYGLYGRLVTIYHVNPYAVSLSLFKHDMLQQGLTSSIPNATGAAAPGPVWMDFCIVAALLAGSSVANLIVALRALGLLAHLANAVLVWLILAKQKPATRVSGIILYAWNPLILLLAVNGMHLDIFLILFILLAIFTFQRKSLILGWAFLILAALINLFALLLLPLFLRLLSREARSKPAGARFLWWLGIIVITVIVVVLAYLPYWQGWGLNGILANAGQVFLQQSATNSLDAVLLRLPVHLPAALAWLAAPPHWTIITAVAVGCFLLLGMWLTDTVGMAITFSAWIWLALLALLPTYWPWYALLPLALALCSANRRTILLAQLLALGALVSLYALLWQPAWPAIALLSVGLPIIIWGWALFFSATWDMLHANNAATPAAAGESRSWRRGLSRPSRPSRSKG